MASARPRREPLDRVLAGAAALGVAFFALPLVALAVRAPWSRIAGLIGRATTLHALRLSLLVSSAALLLSLAIAFPLARLLARGSGRRVALLRALVTVPMVLPPVVAGVGLLSAFGRRGLVGGLLEGIGLHLPLTTLGAIVAATFVSAPFLILALEAGFDAVEPALEEAAATMGASRVRIFRTVTLPALRPALAAGGALCWARAVGEFGATITFAGNLEGRTQTMPLDVFQALQRDPGEAVALSLLLLGVSGALLVGIRARVRP